MVPRLIGACYGLHSCDKLGPARQELGNVKRRLFGKPEVDGQRRMGVALARDVDVEKAIDKAKRASAAISLAASLAVRAL